MQDSESAITALEQGTLRKTSVRISAPSASLTTATTAQPAPRRSGLFMAALRFILRLFTARKTTEVTPDAAALARAAASRAAQLPPPMAFKGDTTNTLVTPMSTYAGKPVEQALRKRAEQQFKALDTTQTTMH